MPYQNQNKKTTPNQTDHQNQKQKLEKFVFVKSKFKVKKREIKFSVIRGITIDLA